MKLEVGKWCRTKEGTIFKIIGGNVDMWKIDIDYFYLSKCENEDYNSYAYNKNNSLFEYLVVKTSYNIIDILEEGDILVDDTNRKLEILLIDDELMVRNTGLIYDNNYYLPIKSIAIKSVITHEQMEQMAYKVGD